MEACIIERYDFEKGCVIMGKGTIKSNDFARGAAAQGKVDQKQKQAARQALLAQARQKAQAAATEQK